MHATLCDLMADIVQNSIEAGASEIQLIIWENREEIKFEVRDNGKGMNSETQEKAIDPFYSDGQKHAHRRVGLGLPFLFQTAEAASGEASIQSEEGRGTIIQFRAQAEHVDLPPFGDLAGTAAMMLSMSEQGEIKIDRSLDGKSYQLSRIELHDALGGLETTSQLQMLLEFIESQEEDLRKAG